MKKRIWYKGGYIFVFIAANLVLTCQTSFGQQVQIYYTKADKSALLEKVDQIGTFGPMDKIDAPTIAINSDSTFQTIDGFGYTLTGGSADLIHALPEEEQDKLLRELFSEEEHAIRVNYLRISIGASDLSATAFTYDEVPTGETDTELRHFTIDKEKESLIPILKKIVAINPSIKILGSPWTAPTWMKTNQSFKGGSLKEEYYQAYADYFVKYIDAMAKEGIPIDAITIQNEPLHPGNNPSMYMEAADQSVFIKTALGPVLERSGIQTKIIVYDHNADRPDYSLHILQDPEAAKYVDGSAFHLYGGQISALSTVHEQFPDKNIYFTEQWVGGPGNFAQDLQWHVSTLIVGATRNWSRNVLEWNLAADERYGPHTDQGGCTSCLGAITIQDGEIKRNVAYYIIGHASKFVPDGSKRIASNLVDNLPNVAFLTPERKKVLIVINTSQEEQTFHIADAGKTIAAQLSAGAVATYIW